jgi:hypothetical protein
MLSRNKRFSVVPVIAGAVGLAILMLSAGGCAVSEYAQFKDSRIKGAMEYLAVDPVGQNLGYDRLMINCRYRPPLNDFVTANGLPDVIFEYNQGPHNGIRLYYLDKNVVYDFLEETWQPESIRMLDKRPLSSLEKAEIKERLQRVPF